MAAGLIIIVIIHLLIAPPIDNKLLEGRDQVCFINKLHIQWCVAHKISIKLVFVEQFLPDRKMNIL